MSSLPIRNTRRLSTPRSLRLVAGICNPLTVHSSFVSIMSIRSARSLHSSRASKTMYVGILERYAVGLVEMHLTTLAVFHFHKRRRESPKNEVSLHIVERAGILKSAP